MCRKAVCLIFLVVVCGFAQAVTFTTDTYIGSGDASYDGQDIIVNNCTLTVDGVHSFNSLQVINGGIVTHTQLCSPPQFLTVDANVYIDTLSKIDASGKGYGTGDGPGKGGYGTSCGAGAGYGGAGGNSVCNSPISIGGSAYGSITAPIHFGSGGGKGGSDNNGGAGGGAIRLTVNGTLTVDGLISANGASSPTLYGGGGSGGSIYLIVGTLSGAGSITANGGGGYCDGYACYGGCGGGGRIAIHDNTNNFMGTVYANGAHSSEGYSYAGQNGTIQYGGSAGLCGDATHPYPTGDLNEDCSVDLLDLCFLADHWLERTVP